MLAKTAIIASAVPNREGFVEHARVPSFKFAYPLPPTLTLKLGNGSSSSKEDCMEQPLDKFIAQFQG
jgi:hypothetical protein